MNLFGKASWLVPPFDFGPPVPPPLPDPGWADVLLLGPVAQHATVLPLGPDPDWAVGLPLGVVLGAGTAVPLGVADDWATVRPLGPDPLLATVRSL